MTAREIVAALRGRWSGDRGMCRCPSHPDKVPSLSVTERDGKVLWHCFAGCSQTEVQRALANMSLLDRAPSADAVPWAPPRKCPDATQQVRLRMAEARRVWRVAAPLANNSAARYLEGRGLESPWPDDLRHCTDLRHDMLWQPFDALVAAVRNPNGEVTAVHRTYLQADGKGKANCSRPKLAKGVIGTGAVRLAPAGPALGLSEGIETGLSAQQLFQIPVWVSVGSRLDQVVLPEQVVEVQIFADNGQEGAAAAAKARQRFEREGRRVFLRPPPEAFPDWNDYLVGRSAA